jgi:hypothetical protein
MVFCLAVARGRDGRWRTGLAVSLLLHVAIIVYALAGLGRPRVESAPRSIAVEVLTATPPALLPISAAKGNAIHSASVQPSKPTNRPRLRASNRSETSANPKVYPSDPPPAPPENLQRSPTVTGAGEWVGEVVVQAVSASAGGTGVGSVAASPSAAPGSEENREPRILRTDEGYGQLAIDPNDERYQPILPPPLRKPGARFEPLLKICANHDGSVGKVTVIRPSDQEADRAIVQKVRLYKFNPFYNHGHAIPFCFFRNYQLVVK